MGKRRAGVPKLKSIKSKAINKNSKRKLDVFGKKQKKGYAGEAVMYMTRSQALRKLSLSLKDFRRICILKGIYPRDPKKKPNKATTYYHVKDISYIANEPIIDYFRQTKAFLKKITRANGRGEHSEAVRKWENKPEMSLDHLVKERYPTFVSALGDMDDALSMIHLFALLPSKNSIRAKKVATCQRLVREWNMYVIKSRCLRKCFISIKGIYYQAEIMGEKITWLVPHKFSQDLPTDVDYHVMMTFLDFYEVFLSFVFYRLYATLGLKYPPTIDREKDNLGSYMYSVQTEELTKEIPEEEKEELEKEEEESEQNKAALKENLQMLASISMNESTTEEEYQLDEAFAEDDEAKALLKKQIELKQFTNLFSNCVFFISREVPRENVEFLILCFGGKIGWEGENSPYSYTDSAITHVIMDRPTIAQKIDNRDYVQPQWLFDCVNNGIILPCDLYVPGKALPPHLSPFVNNEAEGYVPEYQKQIDAIKNGKKEEEKKKEEKKEEKEDVLKFAKEIEMEEKEEEKEAEEKKEEEEKKMDDDDEEEEEKEEGMDDDDEEEEEKEEGMDEETSRKLMMMSKKEKQLYMKIDGEEKKQAKKISTLKKKKAKLANKGELKKI